MTKKITRSYFDNAASTPVAPEVLRAMTPYFSGKFGNPGSLHSFGQEAMAAVDKSREYIAGCIGAKFREVIFTGSATEANNLALRGAVMTWKSKHASDAQPRIIISSIEHESIIETVRELEKWGVEVAWLPVDKNGIVKVSELEAALSENTVLVSVMFGNNETGSIQPIAKISKVIRDFRQTSSQKVYPLLHTDAAQALQFLNCNVDELGVDLMTLSAHKIYGPKGVGALYIRDKVFLTPITTGGGQEFGLRSGTENVPLIAGFAAAVQYIEKDKEKYAKRITVLKQDLWQGVKKIYPRAVLNGSVNGLPHIANIWFPGELAQDLLIRLDLAGFAVSAGSACTARSSTPSHVLLAMGYMEGRAAESLRFSLGRETERKDVVSLLKVLRGFF